VRRALFSSGQKLSGEECPLQAILIQYPHVSKGKDGLNPVRRATDDCPQIRGLIVNR